MLAVNKLQVCCAFCRPLKLQLQLAHPAPCIGGLAGDWELLRLSASNAIQHALNLSSAL